MIKHIFYEEIIKPKISLEMKCARISILVSSEISIGAGLGSSAAFSLILSASLALAFRSIMNPEYIINIDKLIRERIKLYANYLEKIIHTNPSGVDVAVSIAGGMLNFIRGDIPHIESLIPSSFG